MDADRATGADRRRRRLLIALTTAAAGVAVGGGAAVVLRGGGPTIIGPDKVAVGDEAVFTVTDDGDIEWVVAGERSAGPVLKLVPRTVGATQIEVTTGDGTGRRTIAVTDQPHPTLRIIGPGELPVGAETVVSVEGLTGAQVPTWTVSGERLNRQDLTLVPNRVGLVTVQVDLDDGSATSRTFTATKP